MVNKQNIYGNGNYVAGIVGYVAGSVYVSKNVANTGSVSGLNYVAGTFAYIE